MNRIDLTLDHYDFYQLVRGFARGTHNAQTVWQEIVFPNIGQMDADFLDFLWWMLRRDVWADYLPSSDGREVQPRCGADDFVHCMAALHRINRFRVRFVFRDSEDPSVHEVICYRFRGEFHPLGYVRPHSEHFCVGFHSFIPDEWLEGSEWIGMDAQNRFVESGHDDCWRDIRCYDTIF